MKVIRIDSDTNAPIAGALIADSAIRPHRRPLFLPDGEWVCEIRPAVRIERLGKAIPAKFARRYYTHYCLVNCLRPMTNERFTDSITDDTIVAGDLLPIEGSDIDTGQVDSLIERLSHSATFKTGDLIILPAILKKYTPEIDQTVNINNNLEFTIK